MAHHLLLQAFLHLQILLDWDVDLILDKEEELTQLDDDVLNVFIRTVGRKFITNVHHQAIRLAL